MGPDSVSASAEFCMQLSLPQTPSLNSYRTPAVYRTAHGTEGMEQRHAPAASVSMHLEDMLELQQQEFSPKMLSASQKIGDGPRHSREIFKHNKG